MHVALPDASHNVIKEIQLDPASSLWSGPTSGVGKQTTRKENIRPAEKYRTWTIATTVLASDAGRADGYGASTQLLVCIQSGVLVIVSVEKEEADSIYPSARHRRLSASECRIHHRGPRTCSVVVVVVVFFRS